MLTKRIHITGGSGCGVTTLGRHLAMQLSIPHHDTDDYYWAPTSSPFTEKRLPAERLALMKSMFTPGPAWILSGSVSGWGDSLMPLFDMVIFVVTPQKIRLQRLRAREETRFGKEALDEGGWREEQWLEFANWASLYETPETNSRSLKRHEAWLEMLTCPVLRVDGTQPVEELVREVDAFHTGLQKP